MFFSVVLPLLFVIIVVPISFLLYGITRWQSETGKRRERLEATRSQLPVRTFDPNELEQLPEPVRQYLGAALTPGQPLIAIAELDHVGQLNISEQEERWARFRSSQTVCTHRAGFDWDARIHRGPGTQVFVHDTYIAGEGSMEASLFGLITSAEHRDTPELAQAEMMRFLAEAVWYPTKLLPSQGVSWEAIDTTSARATLTDEDRRVSLVFEFDETAMVRGVRAESRYRLAHGKPIETPWEGRFWDYETRGGMRVPTQGEALWMLPDGPHPYWRGQLSEALYKFAP